MTYLKGIRYWPDIHWFWLFWLLFDDSLISFIPTIVCEEIDPVDIVFWNWLMIIHWPDRVLSEEERIDRWPVEEIRRRNSFPYWYSIADWYWRYSILMIGRYSTDHGGEERLRLFYCIILPVAKWWWPMCLTMLREERSIVYSLVILLIFRRPLEGRWHSDHLIHSPFEKEGNSHLTFNLSWLTDGNLFWPILLVTADSSSDDPRYPYSDDDHYSGKKWWPVTWLQYTMLRIIICWWLYSVFIHSMIMEAIIQLIIDGDYSSIDDIVCCIQSLMIIRWLMEAIPVIIPLTFIW